MRKLRGRFAPMAADLMGEDYADMSIPAQALYTAIRLIDAQYGCTGSIARHQIDRLPRHRNITKTLREIEAAGYIATQGKRIVIIDRDDMNQAPNEHESDTNLARTKHESDMSLTRVQHEVDTNLARTEHELDTNLTRTRHEPEKNSPENNEVRPLEIDIELELDIEKKTKAKKESKKSKREEPPDPLAPKVREVIAYYETKRPGSTGHKSGSTTWQKVRARIAEGFTVEQLCSAIDGNLGDEWHQRINKHELAYICQNDAKTREMIAKKVSQKPARRKLFTGWMGMEVFEDTPDRELTDADIRRKREMLNVAS